jgi:CRISPR-associated protein Cmr2
VDEISFWKQKITQFFHDPPGKPFTGFPGAGGHKALSDRLFQTFKEHNRDRWKYFILSPDWAAAGADRPILTTPWGTKGVAPINVRWPNHPIITHPLATGYRLELLPSADASNPEITGAEEAPDRMTQLQEDQVDAAKELGDLLKDWSDPSELKQSFIRLWRRFREELIKRNSGEGKIIGDALWEEMPADTRTPDHSIWDHLKVTTALSFMNPHWMFKPKDWVEDRWNEGAQQPWFLRFSLGPTQAFISEARTSRDLWIGSFLLADLAWHAMASFVESYGPDCIVYPDLCGNPRADCWLFENFRDSLKNDANPSTFAAVLPNAFVVLLPRL